MHQQEEQSVQKWSPIPESLMWLKLQKSLFWGCFTSGNGRPAEKEEEHWHWCGCNKSGCLVGKSVTDTISKTKNRESHLPRVL